jgi:hypothetical protein
MKTSFLTYSILLLCYTKCKTTNNTSAKNIEYIKYSSFPEKCTPDICSDTGYCIEEYFCQCIKGYANYNPLTHQPGKDDNGQYCTYKQTEKMIPFVLEFLLSFGIGHFYNGHYVLGSIKLAFTFFTYFFGIYVYIRKNRISDFALGVYTIVIVLLCVGLFLWQLTDAILLGTNGYDDINGVPLTGATYNITNNTYISINN